MFSKAVQAEGMRWEQAPLENWAVALVNMCRCKAEGEQSCGMHVEAMKALG